MLELDPMKRWLTWTVYATPLMTLTTDLGLSIRVSIFEHVDWWLGPLPRSPRMGKGGDWWSWLMGVIAKGIPRGCKGLFTFVSLGYPLSVFNKNSTLKKCENERTVGVWSSSRLCYPFGKGPGQHSSSIQLKNKKYENEQTNEERVALNLEIILGSPLSADTRW